MNTAYRTAYRTPYKKQAHGHSTLLARRGITMNDILPPLRARAAAMGVLLGSTLMTSAVWADDTEVFFGQNPTAADTAPNVLFLLDTSGSMNEYDDVGQSRLSRMKDALHTILNTSSNVNVGLMRFNGTNGGGAVIYPITPIDHKACADNDCDAVSLKSTVSRTRDDVEERIHNGYVSTKGNVLTLNRTSQWEYERRQIVSMVFRDLGIPSGATITSAKLEFTAHRNDDDPVLLKIRAHDVASAESHGSERHYVTNLPYTDAQVDWEPEPWNEDEHYYTPDISGLVQEVVNRDDWCGGQNLGFSIFGDGSYGKREIVSHDSYRLDQDNNENADRIAPTLHVTYDSSSIPAGMGCVQRTFTTSISHEYDDAAELTSYRGRMYRTLDNLRVPRWKNDTYPDWLVGLRFDDVKIPRGAEIVSARLRLIASKDKTGKASTVISIEETGNSNPVSKHRYNLSNRNSSSHEVIWRMDEWSKKQEVPTPDLSDMVESIVKRSDWHSGNAMTFLLSPGPSGWSYRQFYSFDRSRARAPALELSYKVNIGALDPSEMTYLTAREELGNLVDDMRAVGDTPLVSSYAEAVRYMRGYSVEYGKQRGWSKYRSRYHRVSSPQSYTGADGVHRPRGCTDENLNDRDCVYERIEGEPRYISPMAETCQSNHIVILSDGEPTTNTAVDMIEEFIGKSCEYSDDEDERCAVDLARWLKDTDHVSTLSRKQNIKTHTIGFNNDSPFLQSIATAGDGRYYTSSSSAQLVENFKSILGEVLAVDTTFVAPGATVNQFNRLTHRNDIYFALFRPDERPNWAGNLKRYKLGANKQGEMVVLDANNQPAVDVDTGFFAEDSKSQWSSRTDGAAVNKGGAAEKISVLDGNEIVRKAYTWIGDYTTIDSKGVDFTHGMTNLIDPENRRITADLLDIPSSHDDTDTNTERRRRLIKWILGYDLLDENSNGNVEEARRSMGDPMHSRPVLLNYADGEGGAHTTVFVATNEGYLHAFDTEKGEELFAFMPQELLSNAGIFLDDDASTQHPYGLDGDLSLWHEDPNDNVMVDAGERVMLYVGMRRGGNRYYAFDVTERTSPKLMWSIEGGRGDFRELGQSWSRMIPTKMQIKGKMRNVLLFAAGYDEGQDPNNLTTSIGDDAAQPEDRIGRGFFVVDAMTGERLWAVLSDKADTGGSGTVQKHADLDYSIPSDMRAIDVDFNGTVDQIYVGDMGGQVWRFDTVPQHTSGNLFKGGVLARLSGKGMANSRRFYHEPDVALISREGKRFLSIGIGSGWQATPLNTAVDDRFYLLRSTAINTAPEGYGINRNPQGDTEYTPITEADLSNVTNNLDAAYDPEGWYLEMTGNGEKVLGNALTINNQLVFTSYEPNIITEGCSPSIGGGYIYVLDVMMGKPTLNLHDSSDSDTASQVNDDHAAIDLTREDRRKQLKHGGIPPEPTALLTESESLVLVGAQKPIKIDFANLTQRTYWQDRGEEPYDETTFTTASGSGEEDSDASGADDRNSPGTDDQASTPPVDY
ncbi:MAG: hypothetical protein CSB44_08740 [Gammaproteobacteria bacterium]|nr:MAG: hypothetical protein CSB44_08740 [Gammaproteobacteria bacterium]